MIIIATINTQVPAQWRTLAPGLELGQFQSPAYCKKHEAGTYPHDHPHKNTTINILRIDTKQYEPVLMNASHPNQGESMTAKEWAKKEGMAAAINAAMYQTDHRSSVSLMKTSEHTNNPRLSKDKTVLLFEPLAKGIPEARIADRQCDDFDSIKKQYGSAVQSIRMISCDGKNVWQQSDKKWSIAAVGTDKSGRLLFIQSTAAHSVHDFINILQKLPISIDRAMYMEGGSPSQMYVGTPKESLEFIGDFSTGGKSSFAPHLPNVLGVRARR